MEYCVIKGGPHSGTVKVMTPGGEELTGVISVEVPRVQHNTPVRAKIEMLVSVEIMAQPLMDLEFIKAAAKAHGFRLVMVPKNGNADS